MAISVDWATKVISIPQADLTLISGTIYELDSDWLRLQLKDLEDDEVGMPYLDTHRHNTTVIISGVTFARTIEIINGYSITFEDGQYTVIIKGSNNNYHDVAGGILNQNQVQIIPSNSAGYIVVSVGSGLSTQEHDHLLGLDTNTIDGKVDTIDGKIDDLTTNIELLKQMETGRWKLDVALNQMVFYEDDNITEIMRFDLFDANGNSTTSNVFERTKV